MLITQTDIALFLQSCIDPFAPYLFFAFTLMASFAVIQGVRRLLIWSH